MGPLFPLELLSNEYNLLIGFLIGIGFGFFLEASGFTNTRKLAGVFYGYDVTVIKVFFTAALTALVGLFVMHYLGMIDITLTFFPKTYWIPTFIGAAIMGLGFIIGGFCPGTSLCAAVTGKIDGIVFIIGSFIGIFVYIFSSDLWAKLRVSGDLGRVNIAEWLGIKEGVFIFLFAVMAILTFIVFQLWETSWKKKMDQSEIDELGL